MGRGAVQKYSARCKLHSGSCNKTLTLGEVFSEDDARHRLKQWCIRGFSIPDDQEGTGKLLHMGKDPRFFPVSDLTEADLDRQLEAEETLLDPL